MEATLAERRPSERRHILAAHDVTDLIGLRVIVVGAALEIVDADGDVAIEIPDIGSLSAAAAIARCLTGARLLGAELRAIRKILGLTAGELAARLGEKTSHETISRWEHEKQPMGAYAEKVFRLVACEELKDKAPGVPYEAADLAKLIVTDPWRADPSFALPPFVFARIKLQMLNKDVIDAWQVAA